MAQETQVSFDHNSLTDVMFVDIHAVPQGAPVEVIDVEAAEFAGQIQARIDRERGIVYGLTIQNYSRFRRCLFWKRHMFSTHRAIEWLLASLIAAINIGRSDHLANCPR